MDTTLGKACILKSGKFVSANSIQERFSEGLYPCYGGNGIRGYVANYSHEGTFPIIGRQGALCGNVNYAIGKFRATEHAVVVQPKEEIDTRWLYYKLISMDLGQYATGAAQPGLAVSKIEQLPINIPELSVQQQTARMFDLLERLIALRKEQLAKLDQLVKSRFIELFGDPNTNPMKWKKEQLQINATLLNGRAYKQDELLDNGKYPVLRVGNFFSNRGWYYSDLELDEDKYCDDGDLLYAWSASFGPRIWNGGKVIYHYHIWKVLVGEKYNKQFLCHLLDYATASFMGDTHGIGMMHLTKSGMEETEFIVPPIDFQNQFAAFVEQTDKSKLAIQQSLEKLETLKKSLMQECFG